MPARPGRRTGSCTGFARERPRLTCRGAAPYDEDITITVREPGVAFMHTSTGIFRRSAAAVLTAALVAPAAFAGEPGCPPPGASCATGTLQIIDFESLPAGTPVEGLGAVHADLAITSLPSLSPSCTPGSARVIEEFNPTFPSYGGATGANECLDGTHGFGDDPGCALDYEFTFAPGVTVECFSIRMLDFGDLLPYGGLTHAVTLSAFAGVTLVDQDVLTLIAPQAVVTGDACNPGDPGNHLFVVSGTGITRVTLTFDASPDPNVGFDSIQFCRVRESVPVAGRAWGLVKSLYRD